MKNLSLFFLALVLFITIGCQNNPQSNNTVEKAQVIADTSSFLKNTPPSVFLMQNGTVDTRKQLPEKKGPLSTRCYLPPIITVEQEEYTPSNAINAETMMVLKNNFAPASDNVFNKKSQFFTFNAHQETILQGSEGTTLTIPTDCFETETGNILRGVGQIELKTVEKDIFLQGLHRLDVIK